MISHKEFLEKFRAGQTVNEIVEEHHDNSYGLKFREFLKIQFRKNVPSEHFVVVFHYFQNGQETRLAEYPASEQGELDAKTFALTTEKK